MTTFGNNWLLTGNFLGKPMYTIGSGCSSCEDGMKCNHIYTALCGEIRPLKEDKWDPPFSKV